MIEALIFVLRKMWMGHIFQRNKKQKEITYTESETISTVRKAYEIYWKLNKKIKYQMVGK